MIRINRDNINLENKIIKFVRIDIVKEILEHNYHEERLFSINGDSINRYLNRIKEIPPS